ncbi:hypothetical protein [Halorhabdus sp. BNX81]|uniref:hypothetical protein n=1 Tax=Halorhabdus sp. BNX81 TaxID=2980181 RepID=UPI0023DD3C69|nr:hypothetical protein [Halorhabdus sp. BNX81]
MANLTLAALVFGGAFLIGNQLHERFHFWIGRLFGADPEYTGRFAPIFPTRTEYRSDDVLTKREVQYVSIPGHLFFAVLAILASIPNFPTSYTEFALVGCAVGGGLISWTDDMAARDPEIWIKFKEWMESESDSP